jgi:hypothetical protein
MLFGFGLRQQQDYKFTLTKVFKYGTLTWT